MLQIDIDILEIVEVRKSFRMLDTRRGSETASRIESFKRAIANLVGQFNSRQARLGAGRPRIPDGRLDTLRDCVFSPSTPESLPAGTAMLQGMLIDQAQSLPKDPASYLVEIHDGPADQRRFCDMTMLAVYQDSALTLTIIWMGRTTDLPRVKRSLQMATGGLQHWWALLNRGMRGWSL